MSGKIEVVSLTKREYVDEVIHLLQSLSKFYPDKIAQEETWDLFRRQEHVHSVVALYNQKVVGYGSLVVEVKIRGGKMAHVEDIVSHPEYRNRGIGKKIMGSLSEIAIKNKCYKITLQCKEDKIPFYNNCGYAVSGSAMQLFLKN